MKPHRILQRKGTDMKCTWCGEILNEEETEAPRLDSMDDVICDSCYDDEYMSECPSCCDFYETEEEESEIFLLFEDGFGVPPGIYRPTYRPFYSQPIIGSGNIWPSDVELVGGLEAFPEHESTRKESGYPATFICKGCEAGFLKKYLPVAVA